MACSSQPDGSNTQAGYNAGGDQQTGSGSNLSPPFYSCQSTANCEAGNLCVDQGYCKPVCTSSSQCAGYPYPNLTCRTVAGSGESVCDDQPPTLFGGSSGTGSSSGGATCSGGSYCASCNVCLPPSSCGPYWCVTSATQGMCGTTPNLSGCSGPVHDGCDCSTSSSSSGGSSSGTSGGSSSGGSSSSGSSSSGGSGSSSGGGGTDLCAQSTTLPGGQYNNCVQEFYVPNTYDWLSFRNTCSVAINVDYCANNQPSNCFTMTLAAGASGSTGESQSEVNAYGGFDLAICDSAHDAWTPTGPWTAGQEFCCVQH